MHIPVSAIVSDRAVQVRPRLDRDAVSRYAAAYRESGQNALPPLTVFDTKDGAVLADGFHRLEAARAAGLTELAVEMRHGSWADAYEYAITANAAHGVPLDRDARGEAVRRIKALHPEWGYRRIAMAVGCGHMTVQRILASRGGADRGRSSDHDPRTTLDLLARVQAYSRVLSELLAPGADYVARQIARMDDPWGDEPGSRTPARWAEHLREHEAGFREIADALAYLAGHVDGGTKRS